MTVEPTTSVPAGALIEESATPIGLPLNARPKATIPVESAYFGRAQRETRLHSRMLSGSICIAHHETPGQRPRATIATRRSWTCKR